MIYKSIINPDTFSAFLEKREDKIIFEDSSEMSIIDGTPILLSKESIFSLSEIIKNRVTTQNKKYLDTSSFKNYIRRKILPSLTKDFNEKERYIALSKKLNSNSLVLIVGTGEKANYYRSIFSNSLVVTSDVHNSFKPDFIFDGHFIPFKNDTFDLVLAAQVIEHSINPWKFCDELQRVTKKEGLLQIEAPQNFPYHAEPYDFFRFTFTGFISLFKKCEVVECQITEGNASIVAVSFSNYLINIFSNRYLRGFVLLVSRFLFGWLKYFESQKLNRRNISMCKGFAFTFKKDNRLRSDKEIIEEYYKLKV